MNSNHSIRQKFTLFLPVLSLWLVSCSGEGDSPRPTSFKEHVDIMCESTWDTVVTEETHFNTGDYGLFLGVPSVNIQTSRIRKNTSESGMCECTKDILINNMKPDMFLGPEAESVYNGLKKGTVEELSAENQVVFIQMTSVIRGVISKCVYDAALKGN